MRGGREGGIYEDVELSFFFFNDTATTEIYTLSLHDALPISYVFKWKNEYYMIPETYQASSVRLYKAIDFPAQ